jgi:predicted nucleic acid-binding Zn ribbon protein
MSGLEDIGDLINSVLKRWGMGEMDVYLSIRDRWEEIAGPTWAEHAHPTMLREGILTVEAPQGAATLLRYAVGDLLRSLQGEFGEEAVVEVSVRTPPARRPSS